MTRCTYCPAPAEIHDGYESFCAGCAELAAWIVALELREAAREELECRP